MYEENNVAPFWFYILSLISGFLIVFFTWRTAKFTKKRMKETQPEITIIKPIRHREGSFYMVIVNSKSYNIRVKNIQYRKQSKFPLLKKKQSAIWKHPQTKPVNVTETGKPSSITYIKDQAIYEFHIPNFDHTATYKILVKTSAGNCSRYHTSTQDEVHN